MDLPVAPATTFKSAVPPFAPLGLLDADEAGRWRELSTADCVEFCLARPIEGLPTFPGPGDIRPDFASAKVPTIGDDAIDGDIAFACTVLKP